MNSIINKKIDAMPKKPGVYIMKDVGGLPIYIGKAREIRKRLKSYLKGEGERYTIKFLLGRVADIECIVTDTEKEALILEDTLIKRFKPRYNINLKDDKTYVSLRINIKDEFPRLMVVRRVTRDGARYFGPYSSAHSVRDALKMIREVFPLRVCSEAEFSSRKRPCIDYEMNRCAAPCVGYMDKGVYRRMVKKVILLLEGKDKSLLRSLKKKMDDASNTLAFEEAARIRDGIDAIRLTIEKQVVARYTNRDQDVIGIYEGGKEFFLDTLFIRNGRLIGDVNHRFYHKGLLCTEMLLSFITQFYGRGRYVPDEVIIPFNMEDKDVVQELLSDIKGRRVKLIVPQRGDRLRLLKMAEKNALASYVMKKDSGKDVDETLEIIKTRFRLRRFPMRIEAVDISNISGDLAVGALVSFENGEPDKSGYRRYRIKGVAGPDDYRMMHEVLCRRFRRIKESGMSPDMLLIDGGKGQLAVALDVSSKLAVSIDLVSIAKGKDGKPDRFYIPGRKNPVHILKNSLPYFMLQKIRDEAHRFAISYHKGLRRKRTVSSKLDNIPGVGKKRKNALLTHFKGIEEIKTASLDDIYGVPLIDKKTALAVYEIFHGERSAEKTSS